MNNTIKYIGYSLSLIFMVILYFVSPRYNWIDLKNGWLEGLLAMIGTSSIIIISGIITGVKFGVWEDWKSLLFSIFFKYHMWGVVQQGLLISIFVAIDPHNFTLAYWISLLIFSLSHFPNLFLMPFTFLMGIIFIQFFTNNGNILIPFIAHGLIGSIAYRFIPSRVHGGFLIWMDYIRTQRDKNRVIYK